MSAASGSSALQVVVRPHEKKPSRNGCQVSMLAQTLTGITVPNNPTVVAYIGLRSSLQGASQEHCQ